MASRRRFADALTISRPPSGKGAGQSLLGPSAPKPRNISARPVERRSRIHQPANKTSHVARAWILAPLSVARPRCAAPPARSLQKPTFTMQVIIQPRDGIEPFLKGIKQAKESIEVILYRLDRLEIEQELVEASARGVRVHALVTYTNKEDLKEIKKLEKRLAERGVKITRTAEDLVRYHSKMMVIDRRVLYLLTFNFTFLDIHHSRSFGVITDKPHFISEAVQLFEADVEGQSQRVEAE